MDFITWRSSWASGGLASLYHQNQQPSICRVCLNASCAQVPTLQLEYHDTFPDTDPSAQVYQVYLVYQVYQVYLLT